MKKNKHFLFIQSLRGYAVLFVFLYHLNLDLFFNGFLGVDIFFLISGFVITKSIYDQSIINFDIKNFFLRRIKRLLPALIFIFTITFIVYLLYGFLFQGKGVTKTYVASLFGLSNWFLLFSKHDYFDIEMLNPFYHSWSLGVEEQFYFIYAILIYSLFKILKLKNKGFIITVLVLSIISICLFSASFYSEQFIFYSIITRFWELGLGVLSFFLFKHGKIILDNNILYILYFLLFFNVVIGFEDLNFYLKIILNNILIFLILVNINVKQNLIYKIIHNKLICSLGNISYSFYLWHIPVLYFSFYYLGNYQYEILSFIITIIFSYLTFKFVEHPYQKKTFYQLIPFFLFPIIIVIVLSIFNKKIELFSSHFNLFENKYKISERSKMDIEIKKINKLSKKKIYLIGDSLILHYVPMLNESKMTDNVEYIVNKKNEYCSSFTLDSCDFKKINEKIMKENYESKILFVSFYSKSNFGYEKLLQKLVTRIDRSIKIIIVYPDIEFENTPEACIISNRYCEIKKENILINNKYKKFYLEGLEKKFKNLYIYNYLDYLCPHDTCSIYSHNDDILYFRDKIHLSQEGSVYLTNFFDNWLIKNKIFIHEK